MVLDVSFNGIYSKINECSTLYSELTERQNRMIKNLSKLLSNRSDDITKMIDDLLLYKPEAYESKIELLKCLRHNAACDYEKLNEDKLTNEK